MFHFNYNDILASVIILNVVLWKIVFCYPFFLSKKNFPPLVRHIVSLRIEIKIYHAQLCLFLITKLNVTKTIPCEIHRLKQNFLN